MTESPAKLTSALETQVREMAAGIHDPWKFASEIRRLLGRHIDFDLACLALVHNYPQPHLIIRDAAYRCLPEGETGGDRAARILRIGGKNLPDHERSMIGHVASSKRSRISGDVSGEHFYVAARDDIRSEIAVPVILNEKVLGVINCESTQPDAYSRPHLALLKFVADLIAHPLEELLTERGMRSRVASVFGKVGDLLNSVAPGISLEEAAVLNDIATVIAQAVHCNSCMIWLLTPGGSRLVLRGAHGKGRDKVGKLRDGRRKTARWTAIDGVYPVNFSGKPSGASGLSAKPGMPSLVVPLLSRREPIGVIEVAERTQPDHTVQGSFNEADVALLQALQSQIAVSIELRRVDRDRSEHVTAQSKRLSSQVGIFQKTDLEAALRQTVKQVPKLCDGRYCSIFLWDEARQRYVLRASKGLPEDLIGEAEYARKEGLTGWVAHHGRPLNLDNRQPGGLADRGRGLQWKSKYQEGGTHRAVKSLPWLAAPILMAGDSVGVIRVSERRHRGYFTRV
ncbi:MAG: GAF domain-containing protein [Bryobacteraceae bacterium]